VPVPDSFPAGDCACFKRFQPLCAEGIGLYALRLSCACRVDYSPCHASSIGRLLLACSQVQRVWVHVTFCRYLQKVCSSPPRACAIQTLCRNLHQVTAVSPRARVGAASLVLPERHRCRLGFAPRACGCCGYQGLQISAKAPRAPARVLSPSARQRCRADKKGSSRLRACGSMPFLGRSKWPSIAPARAGDA